MMEQIEVESRCVFERPMIYCVYIYTFVYKLKRTQAHTFFFHSFQLILTYPSNEFFLKNLYTLDVISMKLRESNVKSNINTIILDSIKLYDYKIIASFQLKTKTHGFSLSRSVYLCS